MISEAYTYYGISTESTWISPSQPPVDLPFYVLEAGHFITNEKYLVDRKSHNSYLLLFTLAGRGDIETSTSKYKLEINCATLIDCHEPHKYYCSGEKWEFYFVHLDGIGLASLYSQINSSEPHACPIIETDKFEKNIRKIFSEMTIVGDIAPLNLSLYLHELLNMVQKDQLLATSISPGKYALYVDTVITYIKNHYQECITIDDMIKNIPLSKYYFIKIFKSYTGTTPYNLLINYRVDKAKHLLVEQNLSVEDISIQCGFADIGSFIKHFKTHTHQTPLAYRKWMKSCP